MGTTRRTGRTGARTGGTETSGGTDTGAAAAGPAGGTEAGTGGAGHTGEGGRVETADRLTPAATLEAEASAAIAGAPPPEVPAAPAGALEPAPAGPSPADIEAGYRALGGAIIGAGCSAICPNWAVTDGEQGKLAEALAHACALWFPQEIPEKWVALIVVAGVGFGIASARRDPVTGKLRPLHAPPPKPAAAPVAPAADRHAPVN